MGLVGGDDGRLQGEEEAGRCLLSPSFSSYETVPPPAPFLLSTLLLSCTLAFTVSLHNENLSLIEGAAASWPRAAGLDCDTGYVTVMLIEAADQ